MTSWNVTGGLSQCWKFIGQFFLGMSGDILRSIQCTPSVFFFNEGIYYGWRICLKSWNNALQFMVYEITIYIDLYLLQDHVHQYYISHELSSTWYKSWSQQYTPEVQELAPENGMVRRTILSIRKKNEVFFCVRCPLYSIGFRWPVLPDPWSSDSETSPTTSGLSPPLDACLTIIAARRRDSLSTWPAGRYIGRYISVPRQLAHMTRWRKCRKWGLSFLTLPGQGAAVILSDGSVPSQTRFVPLTSREEGLCLLHAGVLRMSLTLWP